MTCKEIRSLLEALVDAELGAETQDAVTRHLEGCVACHDEAQGLFALAAEARETLVPVQPDRDLWPGIAGHIGSAQRFENRRWTPSAWWLVAAASIGVAIGAALMLARPAPVEVATTSAEFAPSLDLTLASWEQEVEQQRSALLASLDSQRDRLPAESIRAVEENLKLITAAIHEIRTALEKDPNNTKLNFLLAGAYQQEVQLLKRLSHV